MALKPNETSEPTRFYYAVLLVKGNVPTLASNIRAPMPNTSMAPMPQFMEDDSLTALIRLAVADAFLPHWHRPRHIPKHIMERAYLPAANLFPRHRIQLL